MIIDGFLLAFGAPLGLFGAVVLVYAALCAGNARILESATDKPTVAVYPELGEASPRVLLRPCLMAKNRNGTRELATPGWSDCVRTLDLAIAEARRQMAYWDHIEEMEWISGDNADLIITIKRREGQWT